MSSLANLISALIILCLVTCNFVCCSVASRQNVVNLPSLSSSSSLSSILPGNSVNFQTQQQRQLYEQGGGGGVDGNEILYEPTGRAVYEVTGNSNDNNAFNLDDMNDYFLDNHDAGLNNFNDRNNFLRKLEEDIRNDQEIISKSEILMKFLEDPSKQTLPIIYVEESGMSSGNNEWPTINDSDISATAVKRSRYYRRYPWKRHNRNRNYEPDARFLCVPSKDDVLKLLVGLHQNRNGNQHKTVTFCNRKRPAKAIFTNIRFLG